MNWHSAIYVGSVMHRRLRPVGHTFRYRCFWLLLDLAELDALNARLRLFGHKCKRLFSFQPADHGDGTDTPLRTQVDRLLTASGIDLAGGAVKLLCMPRTLGYSFNPLSIYFCHHADGRLLALIHQVHNTFGGRHTYVMPVAPVRCDGATIVQRCGKSFYVSPFLGMDLRYDFRVRPPAKRVAVAIRASSPEGPMLDACLSGEHRPLTDGALLRAFLAVPAVSLKVIAAIHWEAVRLWWKGLQFHREPSSTRGSPLKPQSSP